MDRAHGSNAADENRRYDSHTDQRGHERMSTIALSAPDDDVREQCGRGEPVADEDEIYPCDDEEPR
jgi:hypothetical protein